MNDSQFTLKLKYGYSQKAKGFSVFACVYNTNWHADVRLDT